MSWSFTDESHMSRLFKKYYGITPAAYLKEQIRSTSKMKGAEKNIHQKYFDISKIVLLLCHGFSSYRKSSKCHRRQTSIIYYNGGCKRRESGLW